jgi:Cu/Ag efflux pump CusA
MTSLAFILGCVPLAIAVGASENSRHSIGTGVIGGMLAATVIAIFFIPSSITWWNECSGKGRRPKTCQTGCTDTGSAASRRRGAEQT